MVHREMSHGHRALARSFRTTAAGGGAGAGKAQFQDLSLSIQVDRSLPDLVVACASGRRFLQAQLTARALGGTPIHLVTVLLKNAFVANVQISGSSNDEAPKASIQLGASQVQVSYAGRASDGSSGTPTPASGGWDLTTNTAV